MVISSSSSSPFRPLSAALTPTMSTPNPKKIIRLLRPARETLKMRFGLCCFSLLKKKKRKKIAVINKRAADNSCANAPN